MEDAEKICKRALKELKTDNTDAYRLYFILEIPCIYRKEGRYAEAEKEFCRIEEEEPLTNMGLYSLYMEKAVFMEMCGKKKEALEAAVRYFAFLKMKDETELPLIHFANYGTEETRQRMLRLAAGCMLEVKEYKFAEFFFSGVRWQPENRYLNQWMKWLVQYFLDSDDKKLFLGQSKRILCQEALREAFAENLWQAFSVYPEKERAFKKLTEILEGSFTSEDFGLTAHFAKLLCAYEKLYLYGILGEDEQLLLQAEEFIRLCEEKTEEGYPVKNIVEDVPDVYYQKVVEQGIKVCFRLKDFTKVAFFFEHLDFFGGSEREAYIELLLLAYQETKNQVLITRASEQIMKAPDLRRKWCAELEHFLAAYTGIVAESEERLTQETFQRKAKEYTSAATMSPIMVPVVRVWMKVAELEILSRQMQEIIEAQIKAGNITEAEKLFEEVEQMLPGEEWVQEMRQSMKEGKE